MPFAKNAALSSRGQTVPNWNENPPGKKPQTNQQGLAREGEGGQNGKSKFLL